MANFIGATVVLSLVHPPGAKVRGLIVNLKEQALILNDVSFLHNGAHQDSLAVDGSNVLDLDIEQEAIPDAPPAGNITTVDPAILSYARPSTPGQVSVISQIDAQAGLPPDVAHFPVSPIQSLDGSRARGLADPSAILTEPFDELSIAAYTQDKTKSKVIVGDLVGKAEVQNGFDPQENGFKTSLKDLRKGKHRNRLDRQKNGKNRDLRPQDIIQPDGDPRGNLVLSEQSVSKGNVDVVGEGLHIKLVKPAQLQRGTQPSPPKPELLMPHAGNAKAKKRSRRQRQSELDDQNGWATGEATDIQDMGDFDFEENHKRFDKKKVFEQIRRDDTTADEERLVSFNRLPPRPGTYGGKNLHYTENVLDSPIRNIRLSSDSDSGVDKFTSDKGRLPRRAPSRASERKVPSRKGSALVGSDGQGPTPGILPDIRGIRPQRSGHEAPLSSNPSFRSERSSPQQVKKSLRTAASDHPCRCVTPLQMLELEHLAMSELGITEDVLIENAATAIAQTARKMVTVSKSKTSRKKRGLNASLPTPLIVVLAGNHRTGSRAIAAARQLRNHDAEVLLCVLGLEREIDLLDNVRRQVSIFRKCGGRIVGQNQLMETLNDLHVSNGNQLGRHLTTDLIIDALLGMHLSFEDLKMEHQTAYSQLVQWANMCDVTTISIDVPSGVDASTGQTPDSTHIARLKAEASRSGVILQGDPGLVIEAHHVLSLGAPKIGLLLGRETVASFQHHYSWLVADIGLDESVWRKSGLSARHGVDFGGEWVTKLEPTPSLDS